MKWSARRLHKSDRTPDVVLIRQMRTCSLQYCSNKYCCSIIACSLII